MGKTRALFKKIRHTRGTFHAKMGSIKDRNSMDLKAADPRDTFKKETDGPWRITQLILPITIFTENNNQHTLLPKITNIFNLRLQNTMVWHLEDPQ